MDDLELIAIDVAREAGRFIAPHFGKIEDIKSKSKSPADIVTQFDIDAENLIARKLADRTPDFGFVGEESGSKNTGEKFWLVDPIDGTAHYVRGIPICTTMIALIDKGEVVVSVIYNFVTAEMFSASKNNGAKLNGKPLRVSERTLAESYISVESKLQDKKSIKKYLDVVGKTVLFHSITCGYEFALIAQGKLDGRICIDPYGANYDYAPGALLVKEAGGVVSNISKSTYDYKNHDFIATNPTIYLELTHGKNALFPA